MNFDKLYSALSVIDLEDRERVTVQWYYGDRNLPWSDVDYSKLIENYHLMDNHGKDMSETYVNQFFSLEEIELLKDYRLREFGDELFILEISLPLKTYTEDGDGIKRFYQGPYKFEEPYNTIDLIYGENYGLHFGVSGYYNPYDWIPKKELPEKFIFDGIALIRDVLKSLKYRKKWDNQKLINILKTLYHRNGLYVNFCHNGITREKDPKDEK